MWAIPLLASAISLFFAFVLIGRFMEKRRISDLCYSISLYLFTFAAFCEYYSSAFGWFPLLYKLYYFPAITLVPIMALGTIYLRLKNWMAHLFSGYVLLLSVLLLSALFQASINTDLLLQSDITVGGTAMPGEVRQYSFWLSGIGGIVMIGMAVWSWWKTKHPGNLCIALGAFIMSLGGSLAKLGWTGFLTLSELFGIVVLFYGVITLENRRQPIVQTKNLPENHSENGRKDTLLKEQIKKFVIALPKKVEEKSKAEEKIASPKSTPKSKKNGKNQKKSKTKNHKNGKKAGTI